jgi:hypothetical protein
MSDLSTDPVQAKREASALWIGHVSGVKAVGLGKDGNGNLAIIVYYLDTGGGPPVLPASFCGVPVILRPLTQPVLPI